MKRVLVLWLPLLLMLLSLGNLTAQTVVSDSIVYADTAVAVADAPVNNIVPKLTESTGVFTVGGILRG